MISVVLTHYNKGLLLNRTIDSLQPEDENLHEIIVVDDCSTKSEMLFLLISRSFSSSAVSLSYFLLYFNGTGI